MRKSDLPFGLRDYGDGEFEELHRAGSRIVTASMVPSLLGESPFFGRHAAMAHILGRAALKVDPENRFLLRGHELQPLVVSKAGKAMGWETRNLAAVVEHPEVDGFRASPDALAWADGKDGPGIGEIKVVSKWAWYRDWAEGPPIWTQLQSQAQMACMPEAKWGFIAAFIVELWDVVVFEVEPMVRDFINQQVAEDLAMIRRDELPPPEPNASSYAAICAMFGAPEGEVTLADPEDMGMMMRWLRAQEHAKEANKDLEDARHYFGARAPEARRIKVPPIGVITASMVQRKAYTVEAKEFRAMRARSWQAKDGEEEDASEA